MEIGPLSEWVAAFAEIAAVIVALFLPYYNSYKEKMHNRRNLRLVLKEMVEAALDKEESSLTTLKIFLKITLLKNTDPAMDGLILVGNQIMEVLVNPKYDDATKRQRAKELLGTLDIQIS